MPTLLGLRLDDTGSNIQALGRYLRDNTGAELREALAQAFMLGEREVARCKTKEEIWDRAVQEELLRLSREKDLFSPGVELLLEKGHGGKAVWDYGIHVFTNRSGRRWTLPDGLIQTKTEKIAVELDHGKSLGDWASKLLKAVRLAASPKISGVLFCYFTPCDQRKWFVGGNFTPEFCKILDNGASKPVSIITIGKEFDSVKL